MYKCKAQTAQVFKWTEPLPFKGHVHVANYIT